MKDVFDNIISKANDFADFTGQKVGEMIDVSKNRIANSNFKNSISKDYEELGKYYYDQKINGNDNSALMDTLIDDINEKKEKLSELNEEYEQIKNVIVCPKCNAKNDKESSFCNKCGTKLI